VAHALVHRDLLGTEVLHHRPMDVAEAVGCKALGDRDPASTRSSASPGPSSIGPSRTRTSPRTKGSSSASPPSLSRSLADKRFGFDRDT
jgi:hypothetical protein